MARKKRSVQQHEKTFIHIRKKLFGAIPLSLLCLIGTGCFGWLVWFFAAYFDKAHSAGIEILKYELDALPFMIPVIGCGIVAFGFLFLAILVFAWGWTDKTFVEMLDS